jgi:hypothetical protein
VECEVARNLLPFFESASLHAQRCDGKEKQVSQLVKYDLELPTKLPSLRVRGSIATRAEELCIQSWLMSQMKTYLIDSAGSSNPQKAVSSHH